MPVCMGRARCLCMWGGSGWTSGHTAVPRLARPRSRVSRWGGGFWSGRSPLCRALGGGGSVLPLPALHWHNAGSWGWGGGGLRLSYAANGRPFVFCIPIRMHGNLIHPCCVICFVAYLQSSRDVVAPGVAYDTILGPQIFRTAQNTTEGALKGAQAFEANISLRLVVFFTTAQS